MMGKMLSAYKSESSSCLARLGWRTRLNSWLWRVQLRKTARNYVWRTLSMKAETTLVEVDGDRIYVWFAVPDHGLMLYDFKDKCVRFSYGTLEILNWSSFKKAKEEWFELREGIALLNGLIFSSAQTTRASA